MIKQTQVVRESFWCGITTFVVGFLFMYFELIVLSAIFSFILPGFFYGWILTRTNKYTSLGPAYLFMLLSGFLFMLVVWIGAGYPRYIDDGSANAPVASVIGSTALLIFYYCLIDSKIELIKGLLISILVGLISSLAPLIVQQIYQAEDHQNGGKVLGLTIVLFVFPVWQTLFGLMISLIRRNEYSE